MEEEEIKTLERIYRKIRRTYKELDKFFITHDLHSDVENNLIICLVKFSDVIEDMKYIVTISKKLKKVKDE